VHYWIQGFCRVPVTLGKGLFALGEAFAKGALPSANFRALGKEFAAKPEILGICAFFGSA